MAGLNFSIDAILGSSTQAEHPAPALADEEPPKTCNYTYNALIFKAIESTPNKKITLNGIYEYILANYPEFRAKNKKSWQNSVRHTLTINKKFFAKVARPDDDPGKGGYWTVISSSEELFVGESTGKLRKKSPETTPIPMPMPLRYPVPPSCYSENSVSVSAGISAGPHGINAHRSMEASTGMFGGYPYYMQHQYASEMHYGNASGHQPQMMAHQAAYLDHMDSHYQYYCHNA